MLFAYALAVVLLSSSWETNYIDQLDVDGRRGLVWWRTNIASVSRVSAVVGDGILPEYYTNVTAKATNATLMMVGTGKEYPVPMIITNGSWLLTNWHNLTIGTITNHDDSGFTNLPPLMGEGLPLTPEQARARKLPVVPQRK